MPDYTFVSMFVGIGGLVVAVITLMMNNKKINDETAKNDATMGTKLDFISSDIKDIKADQRVIQRDINEVRDIAMHARDRADAAHNRIDRMQNHMEVCKEE